TIALKFACAIALVAISYPTLVLAKDSAPKKDATLTVRKAGGDSQPEYRKKSTGKSGRTNVKDLNFQSTHDSSSTNLFRGTGSSGVKVKPGYNLNANKKL